MFNLHATPKVGYSILKNTKGMFRKNKKTPWYVVYEYSKHYHL